jgi:hypothetical protein
MDYRLSFHWEMSGASFGAEKDVILLLMMFAFIKMPTAPIKNPASSSPLHPVSLSPT